ncbi:MAG TPA: family 78 glycoside hydrolase catalytic domain [Tepidisphaeraceae bacterium]|nr:family 78 glycoside hydrolase catalytic domain [Tepidisphaeraceae bacterium]
MKALISRVIVVAAVLSYGSAGLALGKERGGGGGLRCEFLGNPQGIDVGRPRLSWQMEGKDGARGQRQVAYRILVASDRRLLDREQGDLWDSGKVVSDRSTHVEYAGKTLESGMRCFWKVRTWDQDGVASAWSEAGVWSMGLLRADDWKGKWVGLDSGDKEDAPRGYLDQAQWIWFAEGRPEVSAPVGSRYFRRTITIPEGRKIKRAVCRVTADNGFVLFANGRQAGTGTAFSQMFEVDVTGDLHVGANVLAVEARNLGEAANPAGMIAAVQVDFEQGEGMKIVSDQQWKAAESAQAGWEKEKFDDSAWGSAKQLGMNGMGPWGKVGASDNQRLAARMLRKEFVAERSIKRATAYICGLGLYELYLNGQKVGDHVMDPGLTEYPKRAFYVTYDVTEQIKRGKNAVGMILGNGRYFSPRRTAPIGTQTYGFPKALVQIEIEYGNGSRSRVVSDETWKLTTGGPIRANNEYDGEEYDARLEQVGWAKAGFDDSQWQAVQVVKGPEGRLSSQMLEPMRVTGTVKPIAMMNPKPGVFIFDMGQNMVGWCRLTVKGPAGTEVSLRHAETLGRDGMLYLDNIRGAKVTDIYTLQGKGVERWEPRFVYHGFRYVEVRGFPGEPSLSAIEGRVVNSDVKTAGQFACSNPLINRIYKNIVWGTRGNYRSFPTDCPQRDERQAWLGDRSAECRGETYLFGVASLYAKWMQDIEDSQKETGSVPDVAPAYWPLYNDNVTWPSTFIIAPGTMYDQYADVRILENRYAAMKKWIEHMRTYMKDDLMPRDTYGDWCVPPESPSLIHSMDPNRKTAGEILGTAYFFYDLRLMARYARVLGKTEDAKQFEELADRMKAAFNKKYFKAEAGIYDNGSQTSSVLPLAFDMVPREHRERVFNNLVEKIMTEGKGHIGTGLIGGQWLMRVLSDNGRADVAYTLASQKTYPSWGYMVQRGATTIWELWNGDTADPAMNSGNHVMLVGDLGIWFYEYVAGIKPDAMQPGFKHIVFRPQLVGDLTSAKATVDSLYGPISSDWKIEGDRLAWSIQVPANATATVYVPTRDGQSVTESGKPAGEAPGVRFVRMTDNAAVYEVGSGHYSFEAKVTR